MFDQDSRFIDCTPQDDGSVKVFVKPRGKDAFYRNARDEQFVEFIITKGDLLALNGKLGVFDQYGLPPQR